MGKRFRREHLHREHNGQLHRSVLETVVILFCYSIMFITLPFSLIFCIRFERLVVFRLGRLQNAKGPGTVFVLPCIDSWNPVDLRTKAFNVPPLQIISSDKGLVEVGATVYYHIKDALAAINSVQDWNQATRTLAHTTIQRKLNQKQVGDMEKKKREIAGELVDDLNQAAFTWGMEITEVQFSDFKVLKQPENNAENVLKALSNPEVAGKLFSQFASQMGGAMSGGGMSMIPQAVEITGDVVTFVDHDAQPKAPVASIDMASENNEVEKLICTLRSILSPALVAQVESTYQINVTGEGTFFLDLSSGNGNCDLGEMPGGAEVEITIDKDNLMAMMIGQLSPFDAYLEGKVNVNGNPKTAIKLEALASHIKAKYGSGDAA